MASLHEKLADSLEILRELHEEGIVAIKSSMFPKAGGHQARLIKNGYIQKVTKGWYIATSPEEKLGETGSWYIAYWGFCAQYLKSLYEENYFIHPDQSINIHIGNKSVPTQLLVRTTKQTNHNTPLLHGTSIWHWESPPRKASDFEIIDGIRMMTLASSLVHCNSTMFTSNPTDMRTALSMITDASQVLRLLLEGGHSIIAGRLAGAFRNIGRDKIADEIVKAMKAAGFEIREIDPFVTQSPLSFTIQERSPYVNRIKLMWSEMRDTIVNVFPKELGLPADQEAYMKMVEDLYVTDAYHSLSIERYVVSRELIEKVRSGRWDIFDDEKDREQKNAMAARGYWQATMKVRESIAKTLTGANPGKIVDADHGDWYRELFSPSITAGILKASDLAGYRNDQVYIGGSKHVPLNVEAVRDSMPILFELLENEKEASVRAVLGHFIFVFIHPYKDGNGRMGRFLMNVMLASGGYPWTVIPVEQRAKYMHALEEASVNQKIKPFAEFIAYLVKEGLKGTPVATIN